MDFQNLSLYYQYLRIHHSFLIATRCHVLLQDFFALAFAFMKTVSLRQGKRPVILKSGGNDYGE